VLGCNTTRNNKKEKFLCKRCLEEDLFIIKRPKATGKINFVLVKSNLKKYTELYYCGGMEDVNHNPLEMTLRFPYEFMETPDAHIVTRSVFQKDESEVCIVDSLVHKVTFNDEIQ